MLAQLFCRSSGGEKAFYMGFFKGGISTLYCQHLKDTFVVFETFAKMSGDISEQKHFM